MKQQRFLSGMKHYAKADYGPAVTDLRAAAAMDPESGKTSALPRVS